MNQGSVSESQNQTLENSMDQFGSLESYFNEVIFVDQCSALDQLYLEDQKEQLASLLYSQRYFQSEQQQQSISFKEQEIVPFQAKKKMIQPAISGSLFNSKLPIYCDNLQAQDSKLLYPEEDLIKPLKSEENASIWKGVQIKPQGISEYKRHILNKGSKIFLNQGDINVARVMQANSQSQSQEKHSQISSINYINQSNPNNTSNSLQQWKVLEGQWRVQQRCKPTRHMNSVRSVDSQEKKQMEDTSSFMNKRGEYTDRNVEEYDSTYFSNSNQKSIWVSNNQSTSRSSKAKEERLPKHQKKNIMQIQSPSTVFTACDGFKINSLSNQMLGSLSNRNKPFQQQRSSTSAAQFRKDKERINSARKIEIKNEYINQETKVESANHHLDQKIISKESEYRNIKKEELSSKQNTDSGVLFFNAPYFPSDNKGTATKFADLLHQHHQQQLLQQQQLIQQTEGSRQRGVDKFSKKTKSFSKIFKKYHDQRINIPINIDNPDSLIFSARKKQISQNQFKQLPLTTLNFRVITSQSDKRNFNSDSRPNTANFNFSTLFNNI